MGGLLLPVQRLEQYLRLSLTTLRLFHVGRKTKLVPVRLGLPGESTAHLLYLPFVRTNSSWPGRMFKVSLSSGAQLATASFILD